MSFVDASILFVFKKNEELHLYMNYKNLKIIIIKNRHLLSFITKMLNRLCKIKCFIELNLNNIYHRIRIKKNDK